MKMVFRWRCHVKNCKFIGRDTDWVSFIHNWISRHFPFHTSCSRFPRYCSSFPSLVCGFKFVCFRKSTIIAICLDRPLAGRELFMKYKLFFLHFHYKFLVRKVKKQSNKRRRDRWNAWYKYTKHNKLWIEWKALKTEMCDRVCANRGEEP